MIRGDASEVYALALHLERASGQVGGGVASELRKAGQEVEKDAKSLAPVDTGALRDSISTNAEGDGRFALMTVEVGPTVDYARLVEYGTSDTSPQPFMRPAFEKATSKLEVELDRIVRGWL